MADLKLSKKRTSEFTREVLFRVKFIGIQQGVLKFGVAIKMEDSNEYNYYCPDKKFGKRQVTSEVFLRQYRKIRERM